jgi:Rod binding domain-containing protein
MMPAPRTGTFRLAISPPSDIVLDVARAAAPADIEAARAGLMRRAGGMATGALDGAFSLMETARGAIGRAEGAGKVDQSEAYRKFEAMVLQTFIQNMLPKEGSAVYGEGMAGDMWKSMLAEKLAGAVAERGGIGIAERLLADRYVEGEKVKPLGPVSSSGIEPGAERETALSSALVEQLQLRFARALDADVENVSPAKA